MLARMFSGPEAISVWVELVQKQKEKITRGRENHLYSAEHLPAALAAEQEISRSDLARWDASARAWLQSADQAKAVNHKQTMLILNNANIPVNSEDDMYLSVTKAWTASLEAMNNLVKGMPQRVQDGAALLALSSWHMYLNMVVYSGLGVEVSQNDPLFNRAALLTLGLQHVREDAKSVYWSLPLACLQYYGGPVKATRSLGQDNSRIDHHEFSYVILGCLFQGWRTFAADNEQGIQWIGRLEIALQYSQKHHLNSALPPWLRYIIIAARNFSEYDAAEMQIAHQLMKLGRRRSTFLTSPQLLPPPLFGLSELQPLLSVLKGKDESKQ